MPQTHACRFSILDAQYSYTYIVDTVSLTKLTERLDRQKSEWKSPKGLRLGIDIETAKIPQYAHIQPKKGARAGLCPFMSRIRLIQIYDLRGMVWVLDMFHLPQEMVVELLLKHKWVAHYAVFDLSHIRRLDPRLEALDIECSLIGAMLVDRANKSPFDTEGDDEIDDDEIEEDDDRVKTRGFGLHTLSLRVLDFPLKKDYQVSDWGANELSKEQLSYAAIDSVVCSRLHSHFDAVLDSYGMNRVYRLTNLMIPVVCEMQAVGMGIDTAVQERLITKWHNQLAEVKKKTDHYFGKVNLNSPKQLDAWVKEILPHEVANWPLSKSKKNLSFARPLISHLRNYDQVAALLDYKKVFKLISTYGESLDALRNPVTGRLHANYSLAETRTGRMSSSQPNGQNYPRDDEFRSMFIAPDGCSILVKDLSQIELRAAGEVSGDPVFRKAFAEGIDLHKLIVHKMTGIPIASISKEQRQLGKAINFGKLFGMGAVKLQKQIALQTNVVISLEEAQKASRTYDELYAGYYAWGAQQRILAAERGYGVTPLGKRRALVKDEVYTKAVNLPVQGGAAEVFMAAMVTEFHEIRRRGLSKHIRINASIHDEVHNLVRNGYEQEATDILSESLVKGMLFVFPNASVNKLSEGGWGKRWSECK